jgi:glutamate N-acetyltransferase/amino-acid N-acetyltransferase
MSKYKKSPLAPDSFPKLPPIAGFDMAVAEAGVRYKGRTDLWVLRGQKGSAVAGVYTKNTMPGAPIVWSRKALISGEKYTDDVQLVVVNSGTANVFTGEVGKQAVVETAQGAAHHFGGAVNTVQIASTGVIGEPLDASKVTAQFSDMASRMQADGWEQAAHAIMTTDTYPKGATAVADIAGTQVRINGIAKGSGMIAPDMATMLAYVATDANLPATVLQDILDAQVKTTFNAITVDSDTSTSDTLLLIASRAADGPEISTASDPRLKDFKEKLHIVLLDLALQIVRDGEGASKFIQINVKGANSDKSAHRIGLSLANSPLVKTAIAGEDANWGRIVMAVGKSGEPADRDKLSIKFGPHVVAENGFISPTYREEDGASYMKGRELTLTVDIGLGRGSATVYTCDLTHGYIDINADYRS